MKTVALIALSDAKSKPDYWIIETSNARYAMPYSPLGSG